MRTRYTNVYWQRVCTIIILCCLSMSSTLGMSSTWREETAMRGGADPHGERRGMGSNLVKKWTLSPSASSRSLRGTCLEKTGRPLGPLCPSPGSGPLLRPNERT